MIIDGAREILQAASAGVRFLEIFLVTGAQPGPELQHQLRQWEQQGVDVWELPGELFRKVCFGQRDDEQVVAVAELPDISLSQLEQRLRARGDMRSMWIGVLEAVEKPGNIGAVARTADAAGLDALILADPATDVFNPNTIRASLGALFHLPLAAACATEVVAWLTDHQFKIIAARVDGRLDYTQADLTGAVAIVLGSEARGLSAHWEADVTPVVIPMHGRVDSLNVSTSAAILFFEGARQRRSVKPSLEPPDREQDDGR